MRGEGVVNCHLCGGDRRRFLFSRERYGLYRCMDCGLVYLSPQPTLEELSGPLEWSHAAREEREKRRGDRGPIDQIIRRALTLVLSFRKPGWERCVDLVRGYLPTGRLLDVGCGNGALLAYAVQYYTVYGCDISPWQVRHAREVQGVKEVVCGTIFDLPFPEGYFDLCVMYSYLEHERRPGASLQRAFSLLRPGGFLFIKVPNYNAFERFVLGEQWRGYRFPQHLTYFTPRTLTSMVKRSGFTVVPQGVGGRFSLNGNIYLLAKKWHEGGFNGH